MRDELSRLTHGPEPGQGIAGKGSVRFYAKCRGDAELVLARAKQVLESVLRSSSDPWPSLDSWRRLLPKWFVTSCRRELTQEEAERELQAWRASTSEEKAVLNQQWTLSGWLYWFQPENRTWYWWDAAVENPNSIQVAVEVHDWPFPWDALRWLFTCAGADSLEAER